MNKAAAFTAQEDKWREPVKAFLLAHPEFVNDPLRGWVAMLRERGEISEDTAALFLGLLAKSRWLGPSVFLRLTRELKQRGLVFGPTRRML